MDLIALFGTIHELHYTISAFTFIYNIFNKKFSISAK